MTDAELLARLDEIGSGDYIRPDDVAPLCREVNEALRRLLNVVTQLQNALSVRDAQRAEITRERDEEAAIREKLATILANGIETALMCERAEAAERERDALRKDAERWRHFRDNMDHCDALHMLANGTDHYDATIDAALAPEQVKDDDDTLPTPQELAAVKTEKRWPVWIEGYRATGEEATASYKGEWPGETFPDACEAWAKADPRRLADFKRLYRPGDGPRYWGCRMFDNERDARRSFG